MDIMRILARSPSVFETHYIGRAGSLSLHSER